MSQKSIQDDVLHFENHSKLTPEEIAKAIAHHNRHHGGGKAQAASEPTSSKKRNPGLQSKQSG
jgi:hypothetical protein